MDQISHKDFGGDNVSCPSEHAIGLEDHFDTEVVDAWQLTRIIHGNTWGI
jgi:hypothetical protein